MSEHTQADTKIPLMVGALSNAVNELRTAEACAKELGFSALAAQLVGARTNIDFALVQAKNIQQEKIDCD